MNLDADHSALGRQELLHLVHPKDRRVEPSEVERHWAREYFAHGSLLNFQLLPLNLCKKGVKTKFRVLKKLQKRKNKQHFPCSQKGCLRGAESKSTQQTCIPCAWAGQFSASTLDTNFTKPQPLEVPVALSMITLQSSISTNCWKNALISVLTNEGGRKFTTGMRCISSQPASPTGRLISLGGSGKWEFEKNKGPM